LIRPVFALLVLLLAGLSGAAFAQPQFPELSGRIVDEAGILPGELEQRLTDRLAAHEQATSNQIVVVTLDSLEGLPIEDYGYQLGRAWGIGQAEDDNGALLIVAPEERQLRIEVGYGLEPILTDALARTIIESVIIPRFREGDMAGGVEAGTGAMLDLLAGEVDPAELTRPTGIFARGAERPPVATGLAVATQLGVSLFLMWLVLKSVRSSRRPRAGGRRRRGPIVFLPPGGFGGRGGGGFGGGGFSGGGGGFGGGGASGSW
jgi:uncharacterized protein